MWHTNKPVRTSGIFPTKEQERDRMRWWATEHANGNRTERKVLQQKSQSFWGCIEHIKKSECTYFCLPIIVFGRHSFSQQNGTKPIFQRIDTQHTQTDSMWTLDRSLHEIKEHLCCILMCGTSFFPLGTCIINRSVCIEFLRCIDNVTDYLMWHFLHHKSHMLCHQESHTQNLYTQSYIDFVRLW